MISNISEIFHTIMAHDPSVMSYLWFLRILKLREIRIDNPVAFLDIDQASSALKLLIPDGAFDGTPSFTHVTSDFMAPVIIKFVKKWFYFSDNAIFIIVMNNHEEISCIRHFKAYLLSLGTMTVASCQFFLHQSESIPFEPSIFFKLAFVLIHLRGVNILQCWRQNIFDDTLDVSNIKFVKFETVKEFCLNVMHNLSKITFVRNVRCTWAFWNLFLLKVNCKLL